MDDFLWLNQIQGSSRQAHTQANRAASIANDANSDLRILSAQFDRLSLACQAMWEIVRDRNQVTEQELSEKITEIDLRDGVEDGKMSAQAVECQHCHRKSSSRRPACLWCGEAIEKIHAFEG